MRSGLGALLLLALVLGGLTACSDDDGPPSGSREDAAAEAVRLAEATLRRRAEALLDGDRPAFERGLDRSDPGFLSRQQTYFDNLQALPVERLRYDVDLGSAVRAGRGWLLVVDVSMQLRGFDAAPVTRPDRYRFVPRRGDDRLVLRSVDDPAWEQRMDVRPEPWDVGPIEVVERPDVLGVFDEGSVGAAGALMDSLDEGRDQVALVVPPDDDPTGVVVYALSTREVIEQIDDRVDPGRVDGVTFAVRRRPGASGTVGYRVALDPGVLSQPGPARDRLVRHELTHVAVGDRARGAPLWVSEGIAEYVSVQAPGSPRDVPASAIDLAFSGPTAMPDDAAFTAPDAGVAYALSWYAMEVLADTEGQTSIFDLLDDVRGSAPEQDVGLETTTGLTTSALARRAGDLLLRTYR